MNDAHSPWPLFTDNLALARAWVGARLQRDQIRLEDGHRALSVGMHAEIAALLAGEGTTRFSSRAADQWAFRLARCGGSSNPYGHLIPAPLQAATAATLAGSLEQNTRLEVQLLGGLGDQLETLSLVLPWASSAGVSLALLVSDRWKSVMQPLITDGVQLNKQRPHGDPPVSQEKALRQALLNHSPDSRYHSVLEPLIADAPNLSGTLCCWRAEGQGNALSAHSRSVPFHQVQRFYGRLRSQHPQQPIIDISAWQPWEQRWLKQHGITLLDPRQGSPLDLARLCRGRRVISIDTALAHLCAACGLPAELLLPRFPDERWMELHRPQHSYGRWLSLHRSPQFGRWDALMDSLDASVGN